jgi:DNA-binding MarR family transcriptional regulator
LQKQKLASGVILKARDYSSNTTLFHQAIADRLGINPTDMKCLDLIAMHGSASATQLATYAGLSTGATTALIDRLEGKRLIERHPHPQDRRVVVLTMSRVAKNKLESLFESLARSMETLMASYSERELKLLDDFFGKASSIWEDERQKLLASRKKLSAAR